MGKEWATGLKVSDERVREVLSCMATPTPQEVVRTFQEAIDARTAIGLNDGTIHAQQVELAELGAKLETIRQVLMTTLLDERAWGDGEETISFLRAGMNRALLEHDIATGIATLQPSANAEAVQ